jgi:Fe2+ transport system protein FeoA
LIPLAFVPEGKIVRVIAIRAGKGLYKRLYELGITENKLLRVVRSGGHGPVIVELIHNTTPFCRKRDEASLRFWCCDEDLRRGGVI